MVIGILLHIISLVVAQQEESKALKMIRLVQFLNILAYIISVAYGWSIRFDHGGRVCSGSFISGEEEDPEKIYLIKSGKFIRLYVFIATGLLCVPIVLLIIALLIIRCVNKRPQKQVKEKPSEESQSEAISGTQI